MEVYEDRRFGAAYGCHHGSGGGTESPTSGILRLPRSARRVLSDAKSLPTDAELG